MKKFGFITQWLSLSFVILLLTASITCGSFSLPNELKAPSSELLAQKTLPTNTDETSTVIGELKFTAVVTHFSSFSFEQVYLLPVRDWFPIVLTDLIPQAFCIPHYYLQFFRYVFGHHIAINAP